MSATETTIVLLPDTQVPYHDAKYVEALQRFVGDFQPDVLAHVGDHLDAPEPSRWNKGMAGEYAPTLANSIAEASAMLGFFREVHDGPFHLKLGNHDERVETYVQRYAPALASLPGLKIETLLGTDALDIDVHRSVHEIAPGWLLAHGHEAGLNRTAGGTAMGLARKVGKSVVCGHTHRAGIQHETRGYLGKVSTLFGMEVGHAMDMRKADYLKYGGANWAQAFGILRVFNRTVIPSVHYVQGRRFVVDGAVYNF